MRRHLLGLLGGLWAMIYLTGNLPAARSEFAQCQDGGSKDDHLWHPGTDCQPINCSSSSFPFPCSIGNMHNSLPNACNDATASLKERQKQQQESGVKKTTGPESCYARLKRISLYEYQCYTSGPNELLTEVSLKFTFELPARDGCLVDDAVMAEFNSKNETGKSHPYFKENQICRTFNFSSEALRTQLPASNIVHEISYDCIGIGLTATYPEIFYYLALTTLPSGSMLNYTMVFMDRTNESLRLAAAAWLTPQKAHIVFEPITGISTYMVRAKSEKWEKSVKVMSTSPSAEISNISSTVTINVTPLDSIKCPDNKCDISITLYMDELLKGVSGPHMPNDPPSTVLPFVMGIVVTIIICAGLLTGAGVFAYRCFTYQPNNEQEMTKLRNCCSQQVFLIGPDSAVARKVSDALTQPGITLKTTDEIDPCDLVQPKVTCILVILHDRLLPNIDTVEIVNTGEIEPFNGHMKAVFNNRPVWKKVLMVQVIEGVQHSSHLVLLKDCLKISSPQLPEFFQNLDDSERQFLWPLDRTRLLHKIKAACSDEQCLPHYENQRDERHEPAHVWERRMPACRPQQFPPNSQKIAIHQPQDARQLPNSCTSLCNQEMIPLLQDWPANPDVESLPNGNSSSAEDVPVRNGNSSSAEDVCQEGGRSQQSYVKRPAADDQDEPPVKSLRTVDTWRSPDPALAHPCPGPGRLPVKEDEMAHTANPENYRSGIYREQDRSNLGRRNPAIPGNPARRHTQSVEVESGSIPSPGGRNSVSQASFRQVSFKDAHPQRWRDAFLLPITSIPASGSRFAGSAGMYGGMHPSGQPRDPYNAQAVQGSSRCSNLGLRSPASVEIQCGTHPLRQPIPSPLAQPHSPVMSSQQYLPESRPSPSYPTHNMAVHQQAGLSHGRALPSCHMGAQTQHSQVTVSEVSESTRRLEATEDSYHSRSSDSGMLRGSESESRSLPGACADPCRISFIPLRPFQLNDSGENADLVHGRENGEPGNANLLQNHHYLIGAREPVQHGENSLEENDDSGLQSGE